MLITPSLPQNRWLARCIVVQSSQIMLMDSRDGGAFFGRLDERAQRSAQFPLLI
jgi:hypothetical protein